MSHPEAKDDEPSDAELLSCIALREDAGAARHAQATFYARHARYFYAVVRRQHPQLLALASMSAEDLMQETFHRAFERAHTFRPDDTADVDRARRRTRAWLGRIAHNLLADAVRHLREVSASPYLERLSCDGIDAESPPSPQLEAVRAGLDRLSERERDVLRVTALYQRVGGSHGRLPNAVSAELAARWGTTNENIRAIRSRALKKLEHLVRETQGDTV